MGSEGAPGTRIHVTGFKKFHGVAGNPTEAIVGRLQEYVMKRGLPNGVSLGSCTVIETAGEGAVKSLYALLNSSLTSSIEGGDTELLPGSSNVDRIIWLHLGVNAGATKFAVECRALNEATFLYPDELGWQPQRTPIFPEDGGISHTIQTTLPVYEIVQALIKKGYDVAPSNDAGRFVCNYVYYHSLHHAANCGFKSLFVHVPLFTKINEETQMQFIAALLEVLASI
ncbi:hypothetical protein KI387_020233 [Taxus chinensis]|uniref:Pyrrolidone-carboxylate peptidase n=1 Tax=Taxus chinensis TaxID=29808 RepID=A0AA38GB93_TAXCH|nr:hypothetical protein KI387_020233 [Taxus chinensis]